MPGAITLQCETCGTSLTFEPPLDGVTAAAEITTFTTAHEPHGFRFTATMAVPHLGRVQVEPYDAATTRPQHPPVHAVPPGGRIALCGEEAPHPLGVPFDGVGFRHCRRCDRAVAQRQGS